ncbi:TIM barrel protein [Roseobacter sp.]|uniref:hydroxypyruvate isomerase family protein n=1 Tax=Roseobacter sp. TaxID=1907202 RepID=UPI003296FD4B
MKTAANLSVLWPDLPYLDRFEAAAQAGFDGVEVLFPYDMPAKETQRALLRMGLSMVLLAAPPPNYTGGARGFAAVPEAADRFKYDLRRAIRYCQALRVPVLQILVGAAQGDAAHDTLVQNLKAAAEVAPKGLLITISPSNPIDLPGSFLDSYDLAAEVLHAVDAPNVALQFNTYEAAVLHGDPIAVLEQHAKLIRHVHVADPPEGEADIQALYVGLYDIAYDGWVGVACDANAAPEQHLERMRPLRGQTA